ncbi:ATP-binding cassette sub-family F member 3 [Larimichthys crocea]|uniref:ATP-binding cassette sub-family F member 3 n=1 Tax=Larimichthys crocea TaxID=215358 RepID=A0A6G0ITE0_LARCR|nr:ATP-binding cassette sub-family F member 3 [Larimichthys crocea]
MATYVDILKSEFPEIDCEVFDYITGVLDSGGADFEDGEEVYDAIGGVLQGVSADSKNEDDVRDICLQMFNTLKLNNHHSSQRQVLLDAPVQLSQISADNVTAAEDIQGIWVMKRSQNTTVDAKKLEKAEAKLKAKHERRNEKDSQKSSSPLVLEEASASQASSKKDNRVDQSGKNRSYDIRIENFDVSFGERCLLQGAELSLASGRRYGLIGRNGLGKTTLLKMLASRNLRVPGHISILHVEQEVAGDETSALQSVLESDTLREGLLDEEKRLNARIANGTADGTESVRLSEIYGKLEEIEADKAPARASVILAGLGFSPRMQQQATKEFSGGWRMRLALARALFARPDLLLLDEPTNMLDVRAILWLENYLQKLPERRRHGHHPPALPEAGQLPWRLRELHQTKEDRLKNQHREYEAQLQYRKHTDDTYRYDLRSADDTYRYDHRSTDDTYRYNHRSTDDTYRYYHCSTDGTYRYYHRSTDGTYRYDLRSTDYTYRYDLRSTDVTYRYNHRSTDDTYRYNHRSTDDTYRYNHRSTDVTYRYNHRSTDDTYRYNHRSTDGTYRYYHRSTDDTYRYNHRSTDVTYRYDHRSTDDTYRYDHRSTDDTYRYDHRSTDDTYRYDHRSTDDTYRYDHRSTDDTYRYDLRSTDDTYRYDLRSTDDTYRYDHRNTDGTYRYYHRSTDDTYRYDHRSTDDTYRYDLRSTDDTYRYDHRNTDDTYRYDLRSTDDTYRYDLRNIDGTYRYDLRSTDDTYRYDLRSTDDTYRFRYNANRAAQVQSKLKLLERLPELKPLEKETEVTLRFPDNFEKLSPPILQLDEVEFYYSADLQLFSGLNLSADLESRICIVGENGAGKSTILKLLMGELTPVNGVRQAHRILQSAPRGPAGLNVCSVELLLNRFPVHKPLPVLSHVTSSEALIGCCVWVAGRTEEEYRHQLGGYGITGELATRPVASLSGGQKSRVAFAQMTMPCPNFYILDEPTNHLDMETIEALAKALNKFKGGVILVSHDERLIRLVCKELWVCEAGKVRRIDGGFDEYRDILHEQFKKEGYL